MQNSTTQRPEIHLIGTTIRTSYTIETNPKTGLIGPCVQRYFDEQTAEKIPHRKSPGTTYCVYTEYESDYTGAYTYFIGEEVFSLENTPPDLKTLTIPPQNYAKFTTQPGPMPGVLIDAWQTIWKLSSKDLGGTRPYRADFEVYDERASDHNKAVLDLFIGVN